MGPLHDEHGREGNACIGLAGGMLSWMKCASGLRLRRCFSGEFRRLDGTDEKTQASMNGRRSMLRTDIGRSATSLRRPTHPLAQSVRTQDLAARSHAQAPKQVLPNWTHYPRWQLCWMATPAFWQLCWPVSNFVLSDQQEMFRPNTVVNSTPRVCLRSGVAICTQAFEKS